MRPPGSPRTGVPGRLHREAAGERPPRARPQRRGSPGPIPNPAVKPAFAESTAARGCGRAGRRARGGRFSICAGRGPRGDVAPAGLFCVLRRSRSRRQRCELCRCLSALRGPLLGGPIHGLRRWPAFFRCAPLPDSAFCWSPKGSLMAIISKLCTVHWRNAGVWECAIYDIGIALPALAGSDADLPKTVGESALRQALSSLES